MAQTIEALIEAVQREAKSAEFPIDTEVYERSGRSPIVPILYAGSLDAALCVVGRDLGKDEVRAAQPLIGAAGRKVRAGIVRARKPGDPTDHDGRREDPMLVEALDYALLTNLVPYKPLGNKAYSADVRGRFRPFLEQLLVDHWKGQRVITLGAEAFEWFRPYGDLEAFETYGRTEARFQNVFRCKLPDRKHERLRNDKTVMVYPLPHPSPLNRRWFSRFPAMLTDRLAEVWP